MQKIERPDVIPGKKALPPKLANKIKRLQLVVSDEQLTKINVWRIHQPGIPNVSQAIRALIDIGLKADASGDKPTKRKKGSG